MRAAITPDTRLLWVETPSNPLLKVLDLPALAELAHEHDVRLVADNTFATPYLTQYIGGHSDVVGGAVCTDEATAVELAWMQNAVGAVGGPLDNYLTLRGLKTLHVRMDRHCDNAQRIAEFLADHDRVVRVHYPDENDQMEVIDFPVTIGETDDRPLIGEAAFFLDLFA